MVLLMLIAPVLVGCWNRVELDDRGIIAGTGVDYIRGRLLTSVQVINPDAIKSPSPGQDEGVPAGQPVVYYSSSGDSFFDSLRSIVEVSGKKLFHAESKVLVVSEAMAQHGFGGVLDFYDRDHEPSTKSFLLVARGVTAQRVITAHMSLYKVSMLGLAQSLKASVAHSRAPIVEIGAFLAAVDSKCTAPIAPGVELVKMPSSQMMSGVSAPDEPRVVGTAVFDGFRLIGWLDEDETRGMLWVKGEVKSGIVTSLWNGVTSSMEILGAKSTVKTTVDDGKPSISVKIETLMSLGNHEPHKTGILINKKWWQAMELSTAKVIKSEVHSAIRRARTLRADFFGFGEEIQKRFPSEWKEWEKDWHGTFARMKIDVKVDANMKRTGKILDSAVSE